ncbi:MAG: bifunctional oligoribonuclease/PAP phosphatase NrnA [Eubacteriales bacterium]|nr:bifunctional oligoribonuclease/PAP phosphatase NrnA [Eubacteriales bacterium]
MTTMREINAMDKCVKALLGASRVAIFSHINPDGDTLGSSLALHRALVLLGKQADLYCENEVKEFYASMSGARLYNKPTLDCYDLCVACDCGDLGRLGACVDVFLSAPHSLNIDHHKTNDRFAKVNLIFSQASSTCEIMFDLLKLIDEQQRCIDDEIAKLLYTGIVTDSGGFTYSNVSAHTHVVASQLLQYDFDAAAVCEKYLKSISFNKFNLKVRVLQNARFFEDGTIGIIHFTQEDFALTNTSEEDTDGLINNIRNIDGVQVAVAITDTSVDNSFKVSIRTTDNVDASAIASTFGGGGHKNAAGCRLNGFYEDVKDKLLKACKDNL